MINKALISIYIFVISLSNVFANSNAPLKTTLDNGLKVIIKQSNKPNVAVAMIWYKVGSADEPGGITGISHALEHMMFKGTKNYPPNTYSKLISQNGGQENAFTTKDYTAYFAKLNSEKLPIFLKLESDRMTNLILEDTEFAKEIKVVREERRMRTDDNAQSLLYERFMALTHIAAPYHHPVVGWMNDLENMKIDDLSQWYKKWYTPNNATIVIVSDLKPKQALALVKKYFKNIKPRPLPIRKPQKEPKRLGSKELNFKPTVKANLPIIMIGYNTPSLITADVKWHPYALDVLSGILSGGSSARLPKELVRDKQSAIQASASYDMYTRYDNHFSLFGVVSSIKNMPRLKQDLLSQIKLLQNYLVSPFELKRIKNQVIASNVYEKDSVFGQAMEFGVLETIGLNYKVGQDYVAKIKAITPKQIQEVAQIYLTKNNMTSAILFPNNKGTHNKNPKPTKTGNK